MGVVIVGFALVDEFEKALDVKEMADEGDSEVLRFEPPKPLTIADATGSPLEDARNIV